MNDRVLALLGLSSLPAWTIAQCSASGTTTVDVDSSASTLFASCPTFSGSIVIGMGSPENVSLHGLQKVFGDLIVANTSSIGALTADALTTITGSFVLDNLPNLSTLEFPELTSINGINWTSLPSLSRFSFDAGVGRINLISIHNTSLQSLNGITQLQSIDTAWISDNPHLQFLESSIEHVTSNFTVEKNGVNFTLNLPSLQFFDELRAFDCAAVSLPELTAINSLLSLRSGTFTDFSLPKLRDFSGLLSVVNNPYLTNLSLPFLRYISGRLVISGNAALNALKLETTESVLGELNVEGNFTTIFWPLLQISGVVSINSTSDIGDFCSQVPGEHAFRIIDSRYICDAGPFSASPPRLEGSLSTPAKAALGIVVPVAGSAAIFIGIFVFKRRRRAKVTKSKGSTGPQTPELDARNNSRVQEPNPDGIAYQLGADSVAYELRAGSVAYELRAHGAEQELPGPDRGHAHELKADLAAPVQELPGFDSEHAHELKADTLEVQEFPGVKKEDCDY